MYRIEGFEFVNPSSETADEYCHACGKEALAGVCQEWTSWKEGSADQTKHCILIPSKNWSYIHISRDAYPVCDECLEILQDGGAEEQGRIILRLLHPKWQKLLSELRQIRERSEAEKAMIRQASRFEELFNQTRDIEVL